MKIERQNIGNIIGAIIAYMVIAIPVGLLLAGLIATIKLIVGLLR